jgi:hypothetical protein
VHPRVRGVRAAGAIAPPAGRRLTATDHQGLTKDVPGVISGGKGSDRIQPLRALEPRVWPWIGTICPQVVDEFGGAGVKGLSADHPS